ncbi:MAG: hypothetical protein KJO26_15225 [Deltaproteobacteria bacterium]|nr:hypothetical protein [Deltaproteobacteria bacterium]
MLLSIKRTLVYGLFLFLIAGCGGGGGGGDDGGGGNGIGDSVSKLIEASVGGTITTSDGYSLEIPPGALPQDETITITPIQTNSKNDVKIASVKFEPDGKVLDEPAKLIMPLPSDWDQGNPLVFESLTNSVDDALNTGREATLTGSPGEYFAEADVSHFSFMAFARNCHAGTLNILMENFTLGRGCWISEVFGNVEKKYGIKLDEETFIRTNEEAIQAVLGTYFHEIGAWDQYDEIEKDEWDRIKEYVKKGRLVVLAFAPGKWTSRSGPHNFFIGVTNYAHTAILRMPVSNKFEIVNALALGETFETSSTSELRKIFLDAKGDVTEVIYTYPADDVTDIETFRYLPRGVALELDLCGKRDCLSDQNQNSWNANIFGPADLRMQGWTAVRAYVEKADELNVEYRFNFEPPNEFPDYIESYLTDYSHAIEYSAYNESNGYASYSIEYSGLCHPDTPRAGFTEYASQFNSFPNILGYLTKTQVSGNTASLADNVESTDLGVIDIENETMFYSSRGIMSAVDQAPVFFHSESGSITSTEKGTGKGGHVEGNFSFNLIGKKKMPDGSEKSLSMSSNGTFDGLLFNENMGDMPADISVFDETACPAGFSATVIHNNAPVTLTFQEFEHLEDDGLEEAACYYGQSDIPLPGGGTFLAGLWMRYDEGAGACGETGNSNNVVIEDRDWFEQWRVKSTVSSIEVDAFKIDYLSYEYDDESLLDAMTEFVNNAVKAEVGWPCDF